MQFGLVSDTVYCADRRGPTCEWRYGGQVMSADATPTRQGRPDALTIVFTGMVVYLVSALVHEGAHGVAMALSPHTTVSFFSSSGVIVDFREAPLAWIRFDLVAGTAADMVVGLLAALMVLRARGSALAR